MRPRIVAGNWKMNTTRGSAVQLASEVAAKASSLSGVQLVVCPPYPYLDAVAGVLNGSPVALGAQDAHFQTKGAFTGEVSPVMLLDIGCTYVLIGHSERRHGLAEPEGLINFKVEAALKAGLNVILCVGETLQEREAGRVEQVLQRQVVSGLAGLSCDHLARLIIAYEPVWAIGTGKVATSEQAQAAHLRIRQQLAKDFGDHLAQNLPILYGGSVTPESATQLFSQPDVDGGLIGGASLKSDDFLAIATAARR
ncbi:MAG: triose-phosphate isomerase [Gemmataceae bacterium]